MKVGQSFALNEVDAMAKKAARGAGYPWGLCEEAAKATRWLCAQGLDGVHVLAEVSEADDGGDPIAAGAGISDRAATLAVAPMSLPAMIQPVMILPFAAQVARQIGHNVTLRCGDVIAVTDGAHVTLSGEIAVRGDVILALGGEMGEPRPPTTRVTPDMADWNRLGRLAHRTYAPSTEESRRLGAGAGLSDND